MQTNEGLPATEGRRSGLRRFVKWSFGIGAFFLGAVVVGVLFLPFFLETFAKGSIEDAFARDHEGTLAIGALDFAWNERQRIDDVELMDPDGQRVLVASLEAPSLSDIFTSGGKLGHVVLVAEGDLVASDTGVSNLERALASRGDDTADEAPVSVDVSEDAEGLTQIIDALELVVDIRVPRLTWSDAGTRALGAPFEVADFEAQLDVRPGGVVELTGDAVFRSPRESEPGRLELRADVAGIRPAQDWPLARLNASVSADGLATGFVDALAGLEGKLTDALGESLSLRLVAEEFSPEDGRVQLAFDSRHASIEAHARVDDGILRAGGEHGRVVAELALPADLIATLMPDGGLSWSGEERASFALERLSYPLSVDELGELGELGELLDGLDAAATLSLPGDLALKHGDETSLVGDVAARVTATPGEALRLTLDSRLGGDLASLIGDSLALAVELNGEELLATVRAPHLDLDCPARFDGARLASREGSPFSLNYRPPVAAFTRLGLPEGTTLELGAPVVVEIGGLDLDLESESVADPASLAVHVAARIESLLLTLPVEESDPDPDIGAPGPATRIDVSGLELHATLEPGSPIVVRGGGALLGGELACDLALTDVFTQDELAAPKAHGELTLTGLATDKLAAFSGDTGAPLTDLLGDTLTIAATASEFGATGGSLVATAHSPLLSAKLAGSVADERFRCVADSEGLELSLAFDPGLVDAYVSAGPEGAQLRLPEDARVSLNASTLEIPLTSDPEQPASLFDGLHLAATLELPDFDWVAADGVAQTVAGVRASIALAPGETSALDLAGGPDDGRWLEGRFVALDPPDLLLEEGGLDRFRVEGALDARGIPSGLIDALASQEGLLLDMLGPASNVNLTATALSKTSGTFTARLVSDGGTVDLEGDLHEQRIVARQQPSRGIEARVPLGPVLSERIVGRLLPMLVDIAPSEGADPVWLSVADYGLPLDGDVSQLDAVINLNLGRVDYKFLPGIGEALGLGSLAPQKSTTLEPMTIDVTKGVASYRELFVKVRGKQYPFSGTFDMNTNRMHLRGEIPLANLGRSVSRDLDKLRDVLDPNLAVPLELVGTLPDVRPRIPSSFLGDVAKNALSKKAGSLLKDLFGGKKK